MSKVILVLERVKGIEAASFAFIFNLASGCFTIRMAEQILRQE